MPDLDHLPDAAHARAEMSSARTAMARTRLSRPAYLALEQGVIQPGISLFDYGCGRGGDVDRLIGAGVRATGWDPGHRPEVVRSAADVVLCGYVLNVIADRQERQQALTEAWSLARRALVVAVRPEWEADQVSGVAHRDGIVTSKGTFQKFYEQDEARSYIEAITGSSAIAVAPGIFFVFKDPSDAQGFRARRIRSSGVRRRQSISDAAWSENRELLQELLDFYVDRGRAPSGADELLLAERLRDVFGSVRAAWRIALSVADADRLRQAESAARDNLLVWLALEAFTGRPRMNDLAPDLQTDVRAHFGSFKQACADADALLFGMADADRLDYALRSVPFGKVLPDAVYIHADYRAEQPPLVRVYEGSGRALIGDVEEVTIIKMSRRERRISYMVYRDFERDPHPTLATSLRVDLRSFHMKWRTFDGSNNPPILHRKEAFVPESHPSRAKFAALTRQEERAGLFTESNRIGTRNGWEEALALAGKTLRGHRVVPAVVDASGRG